MILKNLLQVPSLSGSSLLSQELRPTNSLPYQNSNLSAAEEDLGLFSPPSSPEAPALEKTKGKKSRVLPKVEATPQSSIPSSSHDTLQSKANTKSSSSPIKPAKGGDTWECEIEDLLGDDSDEEVIGYLLERLLFNTNLF